jgi:hypothetical protein
MMTICAKERSICIILFLWLFYLHGRLARRGSLLLDLPDNIHPLHNMPKDDVLSIQPFRFLRANEKLRPLNVLIKLMNVLLAQPFVFGPQFAMDKTPGITCFN